MTIKYPSKTKNFLNLALLLVLLFQWTMPSMEKKREIPINFSDITFVKCNDPEHSHPPLSQRDTTDNPEKFVNSDINKYFVINTFQKCFDIVSKIIFETPKKSPEFLFTLFPPARSPPLFEV